jgi:hypothetical protein
MKKRICEAAKVLRRRRRNDIGTRYYEGDQINEDELVGACRTHGRDGKYI